MHPICPLAYDGLTRLALASRAAPARLNYSMIEIVFRSLFVGNFLTGWTGSLHLEKDAHRVWALYAAIGAVGGIMMLVFGSHLDRALRTELG